jgi:hypothetical protein
MRLMTTPKGRFLDEPRVLQAKGLWLLSDTFRRALAEESMTRLEVDSQTDIPMSRHVAERIFVSFWN